jgi:hypothetical protein
MDLIDNGQEIPDDQIQALVTKLESDGQSFDGSVERFAKWIKELELTAEVPKKEADRLLRRSRNYTELAERLRDALKTFMVASERFKVKTPLITVSVKPSRPAVISVDEAQLPPEYLKPPAQPEVDKTKILEAYKNGVEVPGVLIDDTRKFLEIR